MVNLCNSPFALKIGPLSMNLLTQTCPSDDDNDDDDDDGNVDKEENWD